MRVTSISIEDAQTYADLLVRVIRRLEEVVKCEPSDPSLHREMDMLDTLADEFTLVVYDGLGKVGKIG